MTSRKAFQRLSRYLLRQPSNSVFWPLSMAVPAVVFFVGGLMVRWTGDHAWIGLTAGLFGGVAVFGQALLTADSESWTQEFADGLTVRALLMQLFAVVAISAAVYPIAAWLHLKASGVAP